MKKGPSVEDDLTGKATPMDKEGVAGNTLATGLAATMGEQVTVSMVQVLDQETKVREDPMLAIKKKEMVTTTHRTHPHSDPVLGSM